jgi:uncharacterized membrane protein
MRLIGLLLVLVGMAIVLYGLGSALKELIGVYQSALDDALSPRDDAATSTSMLHSALLGAIGILPLIVGSVLMKVGFFRAKRAAIARRLAR